MGRLAAVAAILAAALAASLIGATVALAASTPRATSPANTCYDFAVRALRQHVVVRHTPPDCAGLAPEDVNEAVARAIRTVVGPLPKAAARRQAAADSRYLASMVRPVGPGRPAPAVAAPGTAASTTPVRLAALAAWLAAATAGARLLASWLSRRRTNRALPRLPVSHAGLATAGLALWVAFLVTGSPLIGWLDVAMTWVIAGLGMATLLADPPGSYAASTSASVAVLTRGRAPVLTIALHGALAATTMALVLLAVVSVG